MLIRTLEQTAPDYDREMLLDYDALYKGGCAFKKRVHRFISPNPQEPEEHYRARLTEAPYRSYVGTIINYFAALLFSVPVIYRPTVGEHKDEVEDPPWISAFVDDLDGKGTNLTGFLREMLVEGCVKRKAYCLLDFPDNYGKAVNRVEAERAGANDIKLRLIKREDLIDYKRDRRGKLKWAIIREEDEIRDKPEDTRDHKIISWLVVDDQRIRRFEVECRLREKPNLDMDIQPVSEVRHGLGVVPLVEFDIRDSLWVGDSLSSPQREHLNLSAALSWSFKKTAYAMPVFRVEDPEGFGPSRFGAGYFVKLGINESADWMAPPSDHFNALSDEVRRNKDEIFRLVTQMSLGVENNSASVGRSAESKVVDAESIQVVLRVYSDKVRDAWKGCLDLLSMARGEPHRWVVEGLDKFETLSPDTLIKLLKEAILVGIPSNTFLSEAKTRAAYALLPGLDSTLKQTIREEVERGVEEEQSEERDLLEIARGVGAGEEGRPEEDDGDRSSDSPPASSRGKESRKDSGSSRESGNTKKRR